MSCDCSHKKKKEYHCAGDKRGPYDPLGLGLTEECQGGTGLYGASGTGGVQLLACTLPAHCGCQAPQSGCTWGP